MWVATTVALADAATVEVGGVGEAADVVTNAGALVKAAFATDARHVSMLMGTSKRAASSRSDGHNSVELFFFTDLVARARLHSPDVQEVGTLGDQLFGAREEASRSYVAAGA
jgi:hypothetical protein